MSNPMADFRGIQHRHCHTCIHPDVDTINTMIKSRTHSFVALGKLFGIGKESIRHHASRHLGMVLGTGGKSCMCCDSSHREEIDAALRAGVRVMAVAREFLISAASLKNHKERHLGITATVIRCSVCAHPERDIIEASIIAGQTLQATADRFGMKPNTLLNHKKSHMGLVNFGRVVRCSICAHERAGDINRDLLNGMTFRQVALRYGINPSGSRRGEKALGNHFYYHLETARQQGEEYLQIEADEMVGAHQLTVSRAKRALEFARGGRNEGTNPDLIIQTAIAIAERHVADTAKEVAVARATLQAATSKHLAAKVALQDAHRRDTELAHLNQQRHG